MMDAKGRDSNLNCTFTDEDEEPPGKKIKSLVQEDAKGFSTPGMSSLNKLAERNGLLNSTRRDKAGNTPIGHEKPAELFRKDLISAMKLADSEHLEEKEYLMLQDPWRMEWEKGVQVPVSLDAIPDLSVRVIKENELLHGPYGFKLPAKKFLHAVKDDDYKSAIHELHESQKLADEICRYDLDNLDVAWLEQINEERDGMGEEAIQEWVMEQVMEGLETQCYNNMQTMIKTVEGLGIEYDEDVVCDVCRSPESEDNNEMVFCDSCDMCVHQACYGITKIPEGSWLCRTCATGVQPKCILCPKRGGAMKSTKSGANWAHVACALWIPEVNFYNPEKMEPIRNISQIPASRWALVCTVCREKTGACIQCAVKSCKTAFHVTCGFHANLDMKTMFHEDSDQVQLKGYCMKHTKRRDGDNTPKKCESPRKTETPKKESEMTEEEKSEARSAKLDKLAEEFYTCVTSEEVATLLKLDKTLVDFICAYWILKRKANFNKPLMTPKTEEADLLSKQQDDSLLARMKMFIHLRQDLERVRNLCYMVSRREKISKQLSRLKESVFYKQLEVIEQEPRLGKRELSTIIEVHKIKNSVYDSHDTILELSRVVDQRVLEEKETPKNPQKARIKQESRRQKPEVPRESPVNKRSPSEKESCSTINVETVTTDGIVKELKDDNTKVKDEHLETRLLTTTLTGVTNLKVKDQNKLTPKKVIEKTVNTKDFNQHKDTNFPDRENREVKGEHVFRKSQLIVPAEIKDKVHTAFQLSRERKTRSNGLCHHAQAKIDRYLRHHKENHLLVSSNHSANSSHTLSKYSASDSQLLNPNGRETRSIRRRLESDLESDANESVYEPVDGEVSIRSSRDTTPDRGIDSLSPRKRGISVSRLAAERLLEKRFTKSRRLDSETESGQEADSESEVLGGEDNKHRRSSRRHSRRIEQIDEDSSQSTISGASKQGTRSKIAENWIATFLS